MSQANSEQIPAIEHSGGVLLRAGAGSGKTFVLIEHMVYQTRCWFQEWNRGSQLTLTDHLRSKYSSTVLMTFTKLAAGEIAVRLSDKLEKLAHNETGQERTLWRAALECFDTLTVTTIDGFFYKLVSKGYFKDLSSDVSIIMEEPRRKKIVELFERWWLSHQASIPHEFRSDAAFHKDAISETLVTIFNDPTLREMWSNFRLESLDPSHLNLLLPELAKLEGWDKFLELEPVVPEQARKGTGKWIPLMDRLNVRRRKPIKHWSDVQDWVIFFGSEEANARLNAGKFKHEMDFYFRSLKDFKKSILSWGQSYNDYVVNYSTTILPWVKTVWSLVKYVDAHLMTSDGITYGDLEYYVLKFLTDKTVRSRIQRDYRYFVVDEFQDTSRIQYDALMLLCEFDIKRLFCVGDAKQAIYGFRGGELAVFNDLYSQKGIKNLLLASNYRSLQNIVNLNNKLFSFVFPLGKNWIGKDPYPVKMEDQVYPHQIHSDNAAGEVVLLKIDLPDVRELRRGNVDNDGIDSSGKSESWRSLYLNQAEAMAIADFIHKKQATSGEVIAVLYKKLAPSKLLINELIRRNIGFTAQAKIPFGEDPLSGILLALIEDILGKKAGQWSLFKVSAYLEILEIQSNADLKQVISQFSGDLNLYGVTIAFRMLLLRIGIGSSFFDSNLRLLDELMALSENNLEILYQRLKDKSGEQWAADFRFGQSPEKVILQTAHGSKGLEYDVVILGGMFTNGKKKNIQDWLGATPGAVMWPDNTGSRERKPTIQMKFENLIKEQKEFSESKRLFYVACTRAKREIVFPWFQGQEDQFKIDQASWGYGLSLFLEKNISIINRTDTFYLKSDDLLRSIHEKPFFHLNNLGLSQKMGHLAPVEFGVTPELAVTKLNSLLDCPRKFYFQQVLKLTDIEEETERIIDWFEDEERVALSSSERGSAMHLALSQAIKHNLVLPIEWVNHPEKNNLNWALNELKKLVTSTTTLISEVPLKFPLFDFMISGIPDLIIQGDTLIIWDFKTGRRNPPTEKKYWMQLMVYALAHWSTSRYPSDKEIEISLCYIDARTVVSRKINLLETKAQLFDLWKNLGHLQTTNLDACGYCPYRSICPR